MAESVRCAVSTGIAWGIALCCIHMEPPALFFNAVLTALLCGIGAFCLSLAQLWEWIPLYSFTLFLLETLAVQLQRRGPYGDTLLAFLLAQGCCSLLWSASGLPGTAGYLLLGLLTALHGILAFRLKSRFPAADRRELDSGTPEPGRIHIRGWYYEGIAAILCLVLTAGSHFITPHSLPEALVWSAAGTCLYWFGIALMILMYAYKKERLNVLIEQQYRGEMQNFMNVIRAQRHDYNFHVRTLAGLVRKGDLDACRTYLEELVQDSAAMNEVLPIWDPAISATIFSFRTLAAREGITLHIDVQNDLRHIATNVYETNKIISNLLQNSIDEVSTQEDKSFGIWLYILKRGQFCVIHTANPFCGECSAAHINDIFRQGYTTKQGHDGVGLSSIKSLAERNRGLVYARLEEGIIHFIAKIPLRYETSDEDRYRREED